MIILYGMESEETPMRATLFVTDAAVFVEDDNSNRMDISINRGESR